MPTRSCVGCRRRREKSELLRLVATSVGRLSLDATQRAPGRGVYICASASCLQRAHVSRGFARGLRRKLADQPLDQLQQRVLAALDQAVIALRQQARRDGRAVDDPEADGGVRVVEPKCAAQLESWAAQRAAVAEPVGETDAVRGKRGRRGKRAPSEQEKK
ncbi:MAG: YlxR family protein [Myxococcales bacterium]|nr:YlxR family protein [Myxococcales bacterium]